MRKILTVALSLVFITNAAIPAHAAFGDFLKKAGQQIEKEIDKTNNSQNASKAAKYNSDKTMVLEAQRQLKRLGYAVSVDGAYGPGTRGAIENFQQSKSMTVNGNVSPKLIKKLSKAPTPANVAAKPVASPSKTVASASQSTAGPGSATTSAPTTASVSPAAKTPSKSGVVSHTELFKIYMASQGDILNVPAVANQYYMRFNFPPGTGVSYKERLSPECKAYTERWRKADEFARPELVKAERAAFREALKQAASWPKTTRITISHSGTLGEYDTKAGTFPLSLSGAALKFTDPKSDLSCMPISSGYGTPEELREGQSLNPGFSFQAVDFSSIDRVVMSAGKAKAYLSAHRIDNAGKPDPQGTRIDRKVRLEARAELGPISVKNGRIQPIPVRILSTEIIDPLYGSVLRTDKGTPGSSAKSKEASETPPGDGQEISDHILTLLALGDHPELATDEWLLQLTEWQISVEQQVWTQFDQYLGQCNEQPKYCPAINKKSPAFVFEWQTLAKSRPALANGPVLDVFRNYAAPLAFVKQEPGWDDRFEAFVAISLFSRDAIEGRDAKFLARDLRPVLKRHLLAAVAKKPERLYMSTPLARASYDFDSGKVLIFPGHKGSNQYKNPKAKKEVPDLFASHPNPATTAPQDNQIGSGGAVIFPPSIQDTIVYRAASTNSSYSQNQRETIGKSGVDTRRNADYWRGNVRSNQAGQLRISWIALDRRLTLASIPMGPDDAEKFIKEFNAGRVAARVTFEPIRTELGKHVYRSNYKPKENHAAPVLFGKVVRVDLISDGKKVIATFGPDQFPSARSVVAAANQAKQAAAANAAAAQQQAASAEEQKRQELMTACETKGSNLDKLKCRNAACQANRNLFGYQKCGEIGQQYSKAGAVDRDCRNRFRGLANRLGTPAEGTPPFESAVARCFSDPGREAYGPDIVGIRLGTNFNDAERAAYQRFSENGYMKSRHKRPYPFENSSLLWERKSANEGIALFSIRGHQQRELLAGIGRRLYFGEQGPKKSDIVKGLRDKYGREASSSSNALVWAFPPANSKLKDKSKCAPLAKMIRGRGGWEPGWKQPIDRQAQQAKLQAERSVVQTKYQACTTKVQNDYMKKFEGASESKINKLSIEMQQEISVCSNEYSAANSKLSSSVQSDNRPERKPLMIEGGNPKGFHSYRACGPVLVTTFAHGEGGRLKGAAFVLFDPSWVGRQPGFMFKSSKEPAKKTGGAEGSAIDF